MALEVLKGRIANCKRKREEVSFVFTDDDREGLGVIWYFEDNALETWCDRCAFGVKRKKLSDRYMSGERQLRAYGEALQEVL